MNSKLKKAYYYFIISLLIYWPLYSSQGVFLSEKSLKPFLGQYCYDCHDEDTQKGGFSFKDTNYNIANNADAQVWQDVLDTLNTGEMPPKKKKQPEPKELSRVLRVLTEGLKKARLHLADQGKAISMRRLNKREYASVIQSLLHLRVDLNRLPDDDSHGAYDTIGSNQFFSPQHFDTYFSLAKQLIKASLEPRRQYGVQIYQPEEWSRKKLKELLARDQKKWGCMLKAGNKLALSMNTLQFVLKVISQKRKRSLNPT